MNRGENDRIHELCSQIAVEQDRARFLDLGTELNHMLNALLPAEDKQANRKVTE